MKYESAAVTLPALLYPVSTLFCSQIREEEGLEVEPRRISVFLPAIFLFSLYLHTEEMVRVKINTRHEVLLSFQQANGCKNKIIGYTSD